MTSPIGDFHGLEEAAEYFLHCAFEEFHLACQLTVANSIFGEKIQNISPPEGWVVPQLPDQLDAWLSSQAEVLPKDTIDAFSTAWHDAQREAESSEIRLGPKDEISTIEILGHVINLSAFVESVMNRQLFYMTETGALDPVFYKALDRTEAIAKLLFVFKQEICVDKKMSPSRITQLFRLRNQAVHFKAGHREKLSASVEDFLGIWTSISGLLEYVKGRPDRTEFHSLMGRISKKWFA